MEVSTQYEVKSAPNRWEGLKQAFLPRSIFSDRVLTLPNDALMVYTVLLHLHQNKMGYIAPEDRHRHLFATVKASHKSLMGYTGFSINKITSGMKALEEAGLVSTYLQRETTGSREAKQHRRAMNAAQKRALADAEAGKLGSSIQPRRRRRRAGKNPDNATARANEYYLRKPKREGGFSESLEARGKINVLPANNIPYFSFPSCVITNKEERWSLAQMSGSEIRVYFSICLVSNAQYKRENNDFEVTSAHLRKMSGLCQETFVKALNALQYDLKLVYIRPSDEQLRNGTSETLRLELCDPLTGSPIVRDADPRNQPANYRLKGKRKRPSLNLFSSEEIEKAILDACSRRGTPATKRPNGELMMCCPFHRDDTPSLCANYKKNGCWECHGCGESGNVLQLLAGLGEITPGDAMISLAATKGIDIEYQDPDRGATIYQYKTADGKKVLKEVVTRIKNGKKEITQRRPGRDGYICDAEGVPPSLYHIERLQWASTVCIVEGEKDADTVTNLNLAGFPRAVVGVTSGGATSWRPEFAKLLKGKNVVVMPDDDEAGASYAEDVKASLDAEGIEYRVVKFGDEACKDVSDFLSVHSVDDLVYRIGPDLVYGWHPSVCVEDCQEITI